jgi:hypothetical protein
VPADVFVYRDTVAPPGDTRPEPGPNDPSYWYDLPGTGPVEETPHVSEATRGPFEPLVSSADPPGTVRGSAAGPDAADGRGADGRGADGRGADGPAGADAGPGAPGQDEQEDMAHAHARKLEQIKDLYLTAEAIGETNVDKHFDQLLAQQRDLISEYFRQSPAPSAGGDPDQAQAGPRTAEPPAGGMPENARVAADPPRVW